MPMAVRVVGVRSGKVVGALVFWELLEQTGKIWTIRPAS